MIKKRYILIPVLGLIVGVVFIAAIGAYIIFWSDSEPGEVVFKATEFGAPVGNAATKDIGPAGGTLSSPDGRLMLTIPETALSDNVAFKIQPVTNKFGAGLGLAYKLEPEGINFATPLEISVAYDDQDPAGTVPEALSLAYQDDKGAWHMQKEIYIDKETKTITIYSNHFSVWAEVSGLQVSPLKATVRVGKKVVISPTYCDDGAVSNALGKIVYFVDKLVGNKTPYECKPGWDTSYDKFQLLGAGELSMNYPTLIYTAPGKKPTPNIANVVFSHPAPAYQYRVVRPCKPGEHPSVYLAGKNSKREIIIPCHDVLPGGTGVVKAEITIIDRGYKVSGNDQSTIYSGIVCDLEKPFTITGTNALGSFPLNFVPSSAVTGALSYSTTYKMLTMTGSGTYTVEAADTDTPKIVAQTKSTLSGMGRSSSGSGTAHFDLTTLETGGCSDQ